MMQIGSGFFNDYTATLRRVYWAEMIDQQMRERRRHTFRASLVSDPYARREALVTAVDEPVVPSGPDADAAPLLDAAE